METHSVAMTAKRLADNASTRTIEFLITTGGQDRDRDTINPQGWELANFKKNPVVLWGHDSWSPPIGKCTSIDATAGGLKATAMFATAEENPIADTVYRLLKGGFLNAVSVGFRGLRKVYRDDGGIDFQAQELLEFSVVSIPSNPDALVMARGKRIDLSPLADTFRRVADGATGDAKGLAARAYLEATQPAPRATDLRDTDGHFVGILRDGVLEVDKGYQAVLASRNCRAIDGQAATKSNARTRALQEAERALQLR